MALKITYDCIACAACVDDCLQQAISEGPGIYVIDHERCVECVGFYETPQCVSICPVDAIVPDPDYREGIKEWKGNTTGSSLGPGTTA